METIKQPARNYRRIRIGEETQDQTLHLPPASESTLRIASDQQKKVNMPAPEKPDNQPVNVQPSKALLLPPQPVRYLKPPKFDFF